MARLSKLPEFQKLPFRAQVGLVAAGLTLVAIGGYAGLVMPRTREITTLKAQLRRQEPPPLLAAEASPPIGEEERKLWAQLEARLRERFPDERNLPSALKAVAELARASRMELVALKLQSPPPAKAGAPVPPGGKAATAAPLMVPPPLQLNPTVIKMSALHRYRDLVEFLDGLESLPVSVSLTALEVKRLEKENRLSTEMTLQTLRWPTGS